MLTGLFTELHYSQGILAVTPQGSPLIASPSLSTSGGSGTSLRTTSLLVVSLGSYEMEGFQLSKRECLGVHFTAVLTS